MKDVVLDPQEILAFYASDAQVRSLYLHYWRWNFLMTPHFRTLVGWLVVWSVDWLVARNFYKRSGSYTSMILLAHMFIVMDLSSLFIFSSKNNKLFFNLRCKVKSFVNLFALLTNTNNTLSLNYLFDKFFIMTIIQ